MTIRTVCGRQAKSQGRFARLALVLTIALFALAACVNDLNPEGGWSGIAEEGEFLYIGSKDGRVVRVARATGLLDRTWTYPPAGQDDLGEIYNTPQISGGVVYGTAFRCRGNECDGKVYAADVETGQSAWATGEFEVESRLVGSVGVGESTLAVGTSAIGGQHTPRGFLIGLDPTSDTDRELNSQITVREKWRIPVDGAVWGGVTVADNVAYFGTLQGTIYAVDLSDDVSFSDNPSSRIQWRFRSGGAIAGTPHVTETNVYFGSFGNSVYSLDIVYRKQNPNSNFLDTTREWSFDTGGWVWAEPLLADGVLYVANLPGMVFALDAASGRQQWAEPAEAGDEVVAQPAIFESNRGPALAVVSGEEDIAVVVLSTGQVSGQFNTDGKGSKASPVVANNIVFIHTDTGQLRQYQPETLGLLRCIEAREEGGPC